MREYRVTFGQQYRRDPHPHLRVAHPDGWLTILAPDEEAARRQAFALLDRAWSMMYDHTEWGTDWDELYPQGELLRVAAPSDGPHVLLCGSTGVGEGQVLVTVWKDGTGEWATRDDPHATWSAPLTLTPAP